MAPTPSTTFGSWLKQRRRLLEMTQAELAQQIPCAEITIRKLESGAMRPGKEIAERLAICLQLAPAEQAHFVLVGRGLATPTLTPGASTSSRPRHNLLEPATAIIGRDPELAALRERLLRQTCRLLTITGTGGIGKTRLLREVALQVKDDFQDGVFFVELAPLSNAGMVLPTIVQVLGLHEDRSTPVLEMLKAFLEKRHLLLLLDNFEHVLDAATDIGALVQALPDLKVVVTSRERLNLAAEQEFPLPPLDVPANSEDDPSTYPSVQLFVQRARAANPDFSLNRANRAAVAELCTRLDGLPLAIELAAGRSKLFGPRALLARLNDRFNLLSGGTRDLPTRHQSLRATLDWSFQLLTPTEQRLLARLGVFMGGATLEAAEVVCRGKRTLNLIDTVASLVDKSLVKRVETEDGEPRLLLLETVRVYAIDQLEAMGLPDETRQRHADYFLGLAEQGEIELRRSAQAQWLAILKAETDNFRTVLSWCIESPERVEAGLRIAGALRAFWEYAGLYLEGYQWVDRLVKAGGNPDPAVQIKAMTTAGYLLAWQNDIKECRRMLEASLALCEATGDKRGRAHTLLWLRPATPWMSRAKHREVVEEALGIFRTLDDRWGLAISKWAVGFGIGGDPASTPEDFARGKTLMQECVQELRLLGDRWSLAYPYAGFGRLAQGEGNFSLAYSYWEQALMYAREGGSPWIIDASLSSLADLANLMGDMEMQKVHYQEVYNQSRHLIAGRTAAASLLLGIAERDLQHYPRAIELMRETLEFSRRHKNWSLLLAGLYEFVYTIMDCVEFPNDVPPDSIATVACAVFGTPRLSPSYKSELWIYAATLLGAVAPLVNEDEDGYSVVRNEWFFHTRIVEHHLDYETFRMALAGGYFMTTEQVMAYALNERV